MHVLQTLFSDLTFIQSNIGVLRLVIELLKFKASSLLVLITSCHIKLQTPTRNYEKNN